jgi:hypothetical protein
MKPKALKILQKEMYIDDLVIYSANYQDNVEQYDCITRRSINQTIEEVDEENASSYISSSQSENSQSSNESRNLSKSEKSERESILNPNNSSRIISEKKKLNKSENSSSDDSSISKSSDKEKYSSKKEKLKDINQNNHNNNNFHSTFLNNPKVHSYDENKNFLKEINFKNYNLSNPLTNSKSNINYQIQLNNSESFIKSSIFNQAVQGNNSVNLGASGALNYTFHKQDQPHFNISPHPQNNQISFNFKSGTNPVNHNLQQSYPILNSLQQMYNINKSIKENQSQEIESNKNSVSDIPSKSNSSSKLINFKGAPLNFSQFKK